MAVGKKPIIVAPFMRAAQLWAYEHGRHPSEFYIVTSDHPDRLRGIGGGHDLIWVHGPEWPVGTYARMEERVAWLRASTGLNSERHVYV